MKVLIIEDEFHAVQYLKRLLLKIEPDVEILGEIDTVEEAVRRLQSQPFPDLIFMDIQLADGLSFDIFKAINVEVPVIFTTAFDQYTLKAFKMNSIDYLLKPIDEEELAAALQKFHKLHDAPAQVGLKELMLSMAAVQKNNPYRQRFLVKQGQSWNYVLVKDVAYFYVDDGIIFAIEYTGKRYILEITMERLQNELDPSFFFRINRSQIIHIESIQTIHQWFNHRLKVAIQPAPADLENIVSRDRVKAFKSWLDR